MSGILWKCPKQSSGIKNSAQFLAAKRLSERGQELAEKMVGNLTRLHSVQSRKGGEEFFFAPKIGYRLIDEEKFKITALTGFRYWHLGQSIRFNPVASNFSGSQNWVDPLVGGRIELFPALKLAVTVFGDVGGWCIGSHSNINSAV
jgi:hypothetical protein